MELSDRQISEKWNQLYPKVYGYFFKRLANHTNTEDLTSVCLTVFFNKLQTEKVVYNQYALLWKIAYYQLLGFLNNKDKKPVSVIIDDDFAAEDDVSDKLWNKQVKIKIELIYHLAEQILSSVDYKIFAATYIDKSAPAILAKELNLNQAAIRKRRQRIIQKLKAELAKQNFNLF